MSWQEDRRLNKIADREQDRQDRQAAAEQARQHAALLAEQARQDREAAAEQDRKDAALRTEQARKERVERDKRRQAARDRRAARLAAARAWLTAHAADLLIAPIVIASAVIAVPAMAEFGRERMGSVTGFAVPVITEAAMWMFAVIAHMSRARNARDGKDRAILPLQIGIVVFGAIAAGMNFLHGVTAPGGSVGDGLFFATMSVAGVIAHQLVSVVTLRTRADRDAARIARQTAAKVTRARRAAVRAAVAEIDDQGTARLVYPTGHYRLSRAPWRRRQLLRAAVPGLPVTPLDDEPWDALDHELARLLNETDPYPGPRSSSTGRGPVATLDENTGERSRGVLDSVPERVPENTPENTLRNTPENTLRNTPENASRTRKTGAGQRGSSTGTRRTRTPRNAPRKSGRTRTDGELIEELDRLYRAGEIALTNREIKAALRVSAKRAGDIQKHVMRRHGITG